MSAASRKRLLERLQKNSSSSTQSHPSVIPSVEIIEPPKEEVRKEEGSSPKRPSNEISSTKEEAQQEEKKTPVVKKETRLFDFTEEADTSEFNEDEKQQYVLEKQKHLFNKTKKGLNFPSVPEPPPPWRDEPDEDYPLVWKIDDFSTIEEYFEATSKSMDEVHKKSKKKWDSLMSNDKVDQRTYFYEKRYGQKVTSPIDCESAVYHNIDFANDLSIDLSEIIEKMTVFYDNGKKFHSDHVYCLLDRMMMNFYSVSQTKSIFLFIKKVCGDKFELFQVKPNRLVKESAERIIYISKRLQVVLDAQMRRMDNDDTKEQKRDVPNDGFMKEINKEIRKYTLYLHALIEIERNLKTNVFIEFAWCVGSSSSSLKAELTVRFKDVIDKCIQLQNKDKNKEKFHYKYNELQECVSVLVGNL